MQKDENTSVLNSFGLGLGIRSVAFSQGVVSGLVALVDATVVFVCGFVIYLAYLGWSVESYGPYLTALSACTILTVVAFHWAGLYTIEAIYRPLEQLLKVLTACGAVFLVLVAVAFSLKVSDWFSRVWTFSWMFSSITLICLARIAAYHVLDHWVRSGRVVQNIVIIGAQENGTRMAEHLEAMKNPWMRVIGVFDDRSSRSPALVGKHPVLGDLSDLIAFAQNHRIDDILVALPWSAEKRLVDIVHKLKCLPVHVRLCPDAVAFRFLKHDYNQFNGLPVLNVLDKPMVGWGALIKELEDRILAALIMVIAMPLMLVIALIVKLDSPGPVFFRQKRYGFNNKPIEVLKFRSMRADQLDYNARRLVTRDDPRLTRVGAFLRRTSLDEVPQFINVLKGEMSLVGPRPHAMSAKVGIHSYEELVDEYAVRHKVKPGITGWAQVNGWRGETDTEEKIQKRVECDLFYIENWSPLFDVYIMFRTVWVVLSGENAY